MHAQSNEISHSRLQREIEALECLLADLRKIREGRYPRSSALQDAPILDHWAQGIRPTSCLMGFVSGHPLIGGDRRAITTSALWHLSPDIRLARTFSRWYRLGRRMSDRTDS